jgi:hypothetical protein
MWTRRLTTDRILLLSILGLAGAAHFLPVVALHGDRRLVGWEVAHEVLAYVAYEFPKRAISEQVDWYQWLDFVGCLSNPLFWFGVVALVLSNRLSGRKAGTIAAVAGVSASLCTLAFLPGASNASFFPGCHLWMAGVFLLSFTGMSKATAGNAPAGGSPERPAPATSLKGNRRSGAAPRGSHFVLAPPLGGL